MQEEQDNNKIDNQLAKQLSKLNISWQEPKSIALKRSLYKCGPSKYVTLDKIPTLTEYATTNNKLQDGEKHYFPYNQELNSKLSLWRGDVTHLEIDGIVNAANYGMLGGGGIDGAIHRAAGPNLRTYNERVHGYCPTGDAKLSPGFKLPAKWILSTVGPTTIDPKALRDCYQNVLDLALKHNLRTIALCGISTGVYGYPLDQATNIALKTVREWLDVNHASVDRIIFVVFLQREQVMYEKLVPCYFPLKEVVEVLEEEEKPKRKLSL
jgi:O-acetyl-ADP-ribose deacetylase (regulator of RNase III)